MRIACHISKKTARLLVQNKFMPCIKTGKKTHSYLISKSDVLDYLVQRDISPKKNIMPGGSYKNKSVVLATSNSTVIAVNACAFEEYPDVLTAQQAAKLTGVAQTTMNEWVKNNHFAAFRKSGKCYIPKKALIEYLRISRYKFNFE